MANINHQDTDVVIVKTERDRHGDGPVDDSSPHLEHADDEEDDEDVDLSCGIWKLRTQYLGTCFSNLYMFSVFTGLSSMFSFMASRIVSVQLESLEKQFKIDNAKAGLFETTGKIGLLSTILFAGHFTRKVNIPVIIGIAGMVQGALLMAPAFLQFAHPYTLPVLTTHDNTTNRTSVGESAKYMCGWHNAPDDKNGTSPALPLVNATEEISQVAFIVVLVAQTMKGVTESFHTHFLPTVYVDDNMLDKSKMSLYLGIRYFINGFSGPIGTEINGILTEVPIDLKATEMDPKDGRFVAAWWLAFLVFGAGLVATSFPLILFPRTLVTKKQREAALKLAAVTYAGGQVEDAVKGVNSSENVGSINADKKASQVPIITVSEDGDTAHSLAVSGAVENLKSHDLKSERKGSSVSVSSHLGRKLSLFPPLEGPTERKVSLTGDLVFDQPKVKRKDDDGNEEKDISVMDLIRDLPKSMLRLLKNPLFVLGIIDISAVSVPLSGLFMFRNVYMTMEYNVPMSEVALASSITSAVGSLSGTLLSSWLTTKVNSKLGLQYIIMGSYLLQVGFNPLFLIFGCDNKPVYGATGEIGIPMNISDGCDCTLSKQLLVCGDDGNIYQSPCYAGCTGVDGKLFTDCAHLMNTSAGGRVTPGVCSSECHDNFLLYAVLHGVQYLVEGGTMIPRWLLLLRIVDPRDRGFATSFYIFFYNIMSIPSPNVFGKLIDNACLIWDGNLCTLYDRDIIRYLMSGLDVGVNVLSIFTNIPVLIILILEKRRLQQRAKDKSEETTVVPDAESRAQNHDHDSHADPTTGSDSDADRSHRSESKDVEIYQF